MKQKNFVKLCSFFKCVLKIFVTISMGFILSPIQTEMGETMGTVATNLIPTRPSVPLHLFSCAFPNQTKSTPSPTYKPRLLNKDQIYLHLTHLTMYTLCEIRAYYQFTIITIFLHPSISPVSFISLSLSSSLLFRSHHSFAHQSLVECPPGGA